MVNADERYYYLVNGSRLNCRKCGEDTGIIIFAMHGNLTMHNPTAKPYGNSMANGYTNNHRNATCLFQRIIDVLMRDNDKKKPHGKCSITRQL